MKPDHDHGELDLDLDGALASVERAIERERGIVAWMRSRPTRLRLALAATAAVACCIVAVALTGNWALVGEAREGSRPFVLSAYVAALAMLGVKALRPMQRVEAPAVSRVLALSGILLPFAAAALPLHDSHEIAGESGYCVVLGTLLAVGLVLGLRVLDRGAHENRRTAMLAVAVAAMASNLALEFHCPIVRASHRCAFHASVGVAIAGAYLTFWMLRRERGRRSLPDDAALRRH